MREVREGLRSLSADWRFALAAIVLLSLTIGATTAVFAVVRAVILRPLPFGAPDRVAMIWQRDLRRALPVIDVAYGEAEDMGRRSRSFEAIGVVGSVTSGLTLARTSPAESLVLSPVSATFFDVVARTPVLGRRLDASDEQGDLPRVGVISHGIWRRRFGGDPHVLGRRLDVFLKSGGPIEQVEIVGVMPADFDFPRGTEIWMPAAPMQRMFAAEWTGGNKEAALRWLRVFYGVGPLRPGVTAHRASIELSQVIRISDRAGGPEPPTDGVVTPVRAYLLGPAEPVLWALLAGSGLMLLVACANVAGLQVSRAARRQRALAIRLALGAHHMDLMRQTLIESLLLTTAAVVLATGVSSLVVQALLQLAPSEVARLDSVTLFDPWVASAGAGLALATLLLCGSWPAMVARRVDACRVAHARRRRELAIRAALGASARRLRSAVLREAVGLVALGCTAGLAVSLAIGRGLASALIGVAPHDAWALTASCGLTMAIGLFACWAPARRAATADPVEALKGD